MTDLQVLAEVRRHVLALQSPTEAQNAAHWLERFQRSDIAVPICLVILREGLRAQDVNITFFAAQTIAERSRLPRSAPCSVQWLPLAAEICSVLRAAALREVVVSVVVLRQLSAAVTRLAAWLCDEWPTAIDEILGLPCSPEPSVVFEALQSLAEEPIGRRLPLDAARRSCFAMNLRSRTGEVMGALSQAASVRPSALPLRVAAAWLRAQASFDACLPMVGLHHGSHRALISILPLLPLAVRGARLEMDLDALKASSEIFDAALALTTDLAAGHALEVIMPLLSAFGVAFSKLPAAPTASSSTAQLSELSDVYATLLAVIHTTFTSPAVLNCSAVWSEMVKMGMNLLAAVGPSSQLMQHTEGSLLAQVLSSLEELAATYFTAKDEDLLIDSSSADEAMGLAFGQLLDKLPSSLALPAGLQQIPDAWELPQLRSQASRIILTWCGSDEVRVRAVLQKLHALLISLPPPGAELEAKWVDLEVMLWFAALTAQAVYRSSVLSGGTVMVPEVLAQLLMGLPQLTGVQGLSGRWAVTCAAAGEFVYAMDPWISQELCSPASDNGKIFLAFLFDIAEAPAACDSAAKALAVVISNLAPSIASDMALCQQVLQRIVVLCFSATMPVSSRQHLVQSALGPLLSLLPEDQLEVALSELMSQLRKAAPLDGSAPDVAVRLLFTVVVAPQPSNAESQLRWFVANWLWYEAAMTNWASCDAIVGVACDALTTVISRSLVTSGASEVLHRSVPLLAEASKVRHSALALSALAKLVRVVHDAPTEGHVQLLAKYTLLVLEALLSGGSQQVAHLPSDLVIALHQLLATVLAPSCKAIALLLLHQQCAISAAVLAISTTLPSLRCPQATCWSLRACANLPLWLQKPESQGAAARILQATLPGLTGALCRLLAQSPVVHDPDVLAVLVRVFLGTARAAPEPVCLAAGQALAEIEADAETRRVLLQQLENPTTTEDSLADVLRQAADSWQAQNTRRLLCAH
mmetsp:Transcript_72870/g.126503  ORF Transcript_72870/g.126503 Transcript_72870/m.126503 type:complete len:983 (+) Transcript_72870:55-3003(+)